MRGRARHILLGGVLTLALALATATLSAWPAWQSLPDDAALIRLSISVSGARTCRDRTAEELAALPPNMRQPQVCERRRSPVLLAMKIDGAKVLDVELPPGGFSGTGPSRIYRRFEVAAGAHSLALRLQTDPAAPGTAVTAERDVQLAAGQNLAIDFDSSAKKFVID